MKRQTTLFHRDREAWADSLSVALQVAFSSYEKKDGSFGYDFDTAQAKEIILGSLLWKKL